MEKTFVLGDNREDSMDSREIGLVSKEQIKITKKESEKEK